MDVRMVWTSELRRPQMDRSQKEIAVKEIEEIFDGAGSVVMAAYSGMTVAEMTELRPSHEV